MEIAIFGGGTILPVIIGVLTYGRRRYWRDVRARNFGHYSEIQRRRLEQDARRLEHGQVSNRILLCGPCNQLKAHRYTLSGLREQNRKLGHMTKGRS